MHRRVSLPLTAFVALIGVSACAASEPEDGAAVTTQVPAPIVTPAPVVDEEQYQIDTPFQVFGKSGGSAAVDVLRVGDASVGESSDFVNLGHSSTSELGPGPSVRAVITPDSSFASLMKIEDSGERITDLAQIPSTLGVISAQGDFTVVPELNDPVELPGSNPENLYFEPQNASSSGDWVLWREGSAGAKNAMPTIDALDWRLIAWNRESNTVQELASSFLLAGTRFAPRSPWDGTPTTDGVYAYYEAYVPSKSGSEEYERTVIRVPLDSPGNVEIIGSGSMPAAADGTKGAFWVEDDTKVVHGETTLFRVESDQWKLAGLVASERFLVAIVAGEAEPGWILVWDIEADTLQRVIETTSDFVAPSLYGSQIVWGSGASDSDPTMYYLDLDEPQPIALGENLGYSVPLVGPDQIAVPFITEMGSIEWQFVRP